MKTEEKFRFVVDHFVRRNEPHTIYLGGGKGLIAIKIKKTWDDGFAKSHVRVVDMTSQLVCAPKTWEHMLAFLKTYNITEEQFAENIQLRVTVIAIRIHKELKRMQTLFGKAEVGRMIEDGTGKKTLFDYLNSMIKPKTPKLTLVKGQPND